MRKTMASLLTLAAVILTTSSISICKPILTQNPAVGSSESTPRWIYIVSIILVATFIFLMGFYFCFCVVPILWRTACHANASSPARAASASEPARAHSRGRTVHFAPSAKNSPGALSTGAINTRPVITTSVMQHSPTSPAFYTPLSPIRGDSLSPEQQALQVRQAKERDDAEARRYQLLHPPSKRTTATAEEVRDVRALGRALAWRFIVDGRGSVASRDERGRRWGDSWVQEIRMLRRREKAVASRLPMAVMQKEGVAKKWCYFEATVTEMEESTVISVGVLTLPYPMFRLVGGWVHSIGYRSDSGNVHQDDSDNGRPFAQPYTKGDTIGCGYDLGRGAVFFTINGKLLGDANFGCKLHDYHMAVSANGLCSLIINVGTEPFLFEEANAAGLLDARSGVSPTVGWAAPKLPPSAVRVIVPAYGERAVADADEVTPSPVSEEGETP